jgi:hypothetical protein
MDNTSEDSFNLEEYLKKEAEPKPKTIRVNDELATGTDFGVLFCIQHLDLPKDD